MMLGFGFLRLGVFAGYLVFFPSRTTFVSIAIVIYYYPLNTSLNLIHAAYLLVLIDCHYLV